ncbi:MAG: ArsR family transcriptional regulator [Streptosporangiaceae bacterium]
MNELAAPFEMTLPGISKHLKMLERCGLISRTRQAPGRRERSGRASCWPYSARTSGTPGSHPAADSPPR